LGHSDNFSEQLKKYFGTLLIMVGYAVAQLFEAMRYKPGGRGVDSLGIQWDFSFT
jgi:hypothetical protein